MQNQTNSSQFNATIQTLLDRTVNHIIQILANAEMRKSKDAVNELHLKSRTTFDIPPEEDFQKVRKIISEEMIDIMTHDQGMQDLHHDIHTLVEVDPETGEQFRLVMNEQIEKVLTDKLNQIWNFNHH